MDIHTTSNVPDVYDQEALIESAIERAYSAGMGRLDIKVVEPQSSLDWRFTVTGEDGNPRNLVITMLEQVDHAALPDLMFRKLRNLLAL